VKIYTGEDLKTPVVGDVVSSRTTAGVLCTAKQQIVTDTAPLKI
jgi:hypothetical protein